LNGFARRGEIQKSAAAGKSTLSQMHIPPAAALLQIVKQHWLKKTRTKLLSSELFDRLHTLSQVLFYLPISDHTRPQWVCHEISHQINHRHLSYCPLEFSWKWCPTGYIWVKQRIQSVAISFCLAVIHPSSPCYDVMQVTEVYIWSKNLREKKNVENVKLNLHKGYFNLPANRTRLNIWALATFYHYQKLDPDINQKKLRYNIGFMKDARPHHWKWIFWAFNLKQHQKVSNRSL